MRFVIAVILVVLYVVISLATSKGVSDIGVFASYIFGGAILAPALIASLFCIPKSGRNNKRFFRVFNVVLVLSLFGQAGEIAELVEMAGKPPKAIVGSNGQVEIFVPASWRSIEPPNENIVLNLKDGSGYLNVIVGYDYAGVDRLELEHYAKLMGQDVRDNVPDFKSISEVESCGSTKMECVYQIVNATTGDKGVITVLANLYGEEGYYNFFAITNPGLFEIYEKDIFSALRSLDEN